MKTHARRIATGGIVAPLALLLATLIANEGQTLLGLHLDQTALAVYLVPFLLGAAHVLNGLFKVEASAIGKDIGSLVKDAGGLGGLLAGASSMPKMPPMPPGVGGVPGGPVVDMPPPAFSPPTAPTEAEPPDWVPPSPPDPPPAP